MSSIVILFSNDLFFSNYSINIMATNNNIKYHNNNHPFTKSKTITENCPSFNNRFKTEINAKHCNTRFIFRISNTKSFHNCKTMTKMAAILCNTRLLSKSQSEINHKNHKNNIFILVTYHIHPNH